MADDDWQVQVTGDRVTRGTHRLAMDVDPRRRLLTLGPQVRSGGPPELWQGAVIRRFFDGDEVRWESALAWLKSDPAQTLLAGISAGYQAEMLWSGDWSVRWSEDAWGALERLHAGVMAQLTPRP